MFELFSWVSFVFAAGSTSFFLRNLSEFRTAPKAGADSSQLPPVSVLIPAATRQPESAKRSRQFWPAEVSNWKSWCSMIKVVT